VNAYTISARWLFTHLGPHDLHLFLREEVWDLVKLANVDDVRDEANGHEGGNVLNDWVFEDSTEAPAGKEVIHIC
jgi:hypothetical protein